jgi:hypothetical protein
MPTVAVLTTCVLAFAMAAAAFRKLGRSDRVVAEYRAAGVDEVHLAPLAVVLLIGAAALLVGLAWAPLGIAAGAGAFVYFVLAVVWHARAGDLVHAGTPVALVLLAAASVVTTLSS